jgi:outer membrane protein assembly factor BamB
MRYILLLLCFAFVACSTPPVRQLAIEKQWVRSTLAKPYLGGRRLHRFTPIVTDDMIIEGNSIDGVVAYDRKRVFVRWRMNVFDGVEAGAQLYDGILYFGAGDGFFYAVNSVDCRVIWSYPLKAEGLGKPTVVGENVYVLAGNNIVHALNTKTGKLLWTYNRRDASNLSIRGGCQPAVVGDVVYVGFSDGSLVALNRNSGNVLWEANLNPNKRFRDVDASPVIEGDVIYESSYDGRLYALQRQDGKVIWSIEAGGYEEVLLVGKTLFLSSSEGKTLAIDRSTGKEIWSKSNPNGIATAPVLWRGVLIMGEMDGTLRFLDGRTGDLLASFDPGRGVTSKPFLDKDTGELFFISADANLYSLRLSWKKRISEWPWEKSL